MKKKTNRKNYKSRHEETNRSFEKKKRREKEQLFTDDTIRAIKNFDELNEKKRVRAKKNET